MSLRVCRKQRWIWYHCQDLPQRLMRRLASFPLLQAPNSRGDGGGALFVFSALEISIPRNRALRLVCLRCPHACCRTKLLEIRMTS